MTSEVSVIIGHPVIKSNNFFVLFTSKYEKMCDPNSLFQLKDKNALQLCKTLGIWLEEIRNPKKNLSLSIILPKCRS